MGRRAASSHSANGSSPGRPAPCEPAHEPFRPCGAELVARDARRGDLQQDLAGAPALADQGAADVDAPDGQVVAEGPRSQLAAQLPTPPLVVLGGIGVQRLVVPAVRLGVALLVAVDVVSPDPDPPWHRVLPDRGPHRLPPPADLLGVPTFTDSITPTTSPSTAAWLHGQATRLRHGNAARRGVLPGGVMSMDRWRPRSRRRPARALAAGALVLLARPLHHRERPGPPSPPAAARPATSTASLTGPTGLRLLGRAIAPAGGRRPGHQPAVAASPGRHVPVAGVGHQDAIVAATGRCS